MSISQNERERAIYRSRRKFQTDMQSNLATAEDNGRAEGRAEGIVENSLMSIKNLIETLNLTIEQAMAVLEIPAAEQQRYADLLKQQS